MKPKEVAERLGKSVAVVLAWLKRGHLKGVNLASDPNRRPLWDVPDKNLKAFIDKGGVGLPVKDKKPQKRRARRVATNLVFGKGGK
jgi:hypothetical protein